MQSLLALVISTLLTSCTNVYPTKTVYIDRLPSTSYPTNTRRTTPEYNEYSSQDRAEAYSDYSEPESVDVEPPLEQPDPIAIDWAPPPVRIESAPPPPYPNATWVEGYWTWQGDWVWARGHWASPPRPGYTWVHPYYEHRDRRVVFVDGFWAAPRTRFIPPPRPEPRPQNPQQFDRRPDSIRPHHEPNNPRINQNYERHFQKPNPHPPHTNPEEEKR